MTDAEYSRQYHKKYPLGKNPATKECKYCSQTFHCHRNRVEKAKFCSRSCASRYRSGPLASNWQGGKTIGRALWQSSKACRDWRKAVFERDNYTCVNCGDNTGGNLQADHIMPWAYYPELREDVDNGRTLCVPCHKKTETYGSKSRKLARIGAFAQ